MDYNPNNSRTLRDEFAMAALTGILQREIKHCPSCDGNDCQVWEKPARLAYEAADEMMKARQKYSGDGLVGMLTPLQAKSAPDPEPRNAANDAI